MKEGKIKLISRAALIRLSYVATFLIISITWLWFTLFQMPGKSYQGELSRLSASETALQ